MSEERSEYVVESLPKPKTDLSAELLSAFTLASYYAQQANLKQSQLRDDLDNQCKEHKDWLKQQVRRIVYARGTREGWSLYNCRVFFMPNHSTRPISGSIIAELTVDFSQGRRSGELRMSACWDEVGQMLADFQALVSNATPHPLPGGEKGIES